MQTLIAAQDAVNAVQPLLQNGGDVIMAAPSGEKFASNIRNFVAPIVLLGIGLASLVFLIQRQMTQALQFFVITIFVSAFFYAPGFVEGLGKTLAKFLS